MDSDKFITYSDIYVDVVKIDDRIYNVDYVIDDYVNEFEEHRFTFSVFDTENEAEKYADSLRYIIDNAHFEFEVL